MTIPLDEIAAAAERAMASIGNDPDRLHEINDADLNAVALKVKTLAPIAEQMLIEQCGGEDAANAALGKLKGYKQARLIKLVQAAQRAIKLKHVLTQSQLAALVIDAQVGVGFVLVEQERRLAIRAGCMN